MSVESNDIHPFEVVALAAVSFFAFAMGYSLPLFAAILLFAWPILLLHLLAQGLFEGVWLAVRRVYRMWRPAPPEPARPSEDQPAPREGWLRYIWWLPLLCMTLGYAKYVSETGRWVL